MTDSGGQQVGGHDAPHGEASDGTRLLEAVLESTPSAIAIYAADEGSPGGSRLVRVSSAFTELTGYSSADLDGTGLDFMAGPDTDSRIWRRLLSAVVAGQSAEGVVRLYRKDGTAFWDEVNLAPIQLGDEEPSPFGPFWMARHTDVSERRESDRVREQQLAFLSLMGATVPYQAAVLDADGLILAVNQEWHSFWGALTAGGIDALPGDNFLDACLHQFNMADQVRHHVVDGLRSVAQGRRETFSLDYEYKGADRVTWYEFQCTGITAVDLPDPQAASVSAGSAVVTLIDITPRKQNEAELSRRALTDLLTGLLNRAGLVTRLASAPSVAHAAVVLIDLDLFKRVNDSYGHSVGDELLVTVAFRINEIVDDEALVVRLGGDGFLVYLPGATSADAVQSAEVLLDAVRAPAPLRGGSVEVAVTATAGVADTATSDGIESLLRDADAAMYRGKELGRNRVEVYTPALFERARGRLDTEMGLRRAVDEHEFVLHYQPVIDLRTGETIAQEALLRWQTPGGLLLPGAFLDVAESSGLIRPIGRWVLGEALRQAAEWRAAGRDWVVHVNLAGGQLQNDEIVGILTAALAANDLPGSSVCLEVTETELLPTIDGASGVLEALHATGAGLALDDFGVGYFSLSHLIDLPVTMLKIDRSFVQGLERASHVALVSALTTLSEQLDLQIVAEGLETPEQVAHIRELGCVIGQGYLLGRPVRDAVPGQL